MEERINAILADEKSRSKAGAGEKEPAADANPPAPKAEALLEIDTADRVELGRLLKEIHTVTGKIDHIGTHYSEMLRFCSAKGCHSMVFACS